MKITIENLSMVYPNGKTALDQISCTLESPNLIGLLGPNGAGKSTLMKLLTAALVPTSGRILVDGEPLLKHEQQLKQQLGYLPQAFGLYDELTIWQFLDYMAALKQINQPAKAIEQAIRDTNLNAKRKSRISSLSGGERQRVGIAQAMLVDDPQFLILDEPTVGLDPKERLDFRNLFSKKAQDRLVLLSTHIIDDVQSVCNQLIVIDHGRILFIGTPAQLIASARGHVALFNDQPVSDKIHITARINTAEGIQCRGVAENMPADSMLVEPTLEDAYMYLIQYKGA